MRRLIAFLFSSIAFLSVAAFAQTPLPVTGNLSQILGSPQPYAGVSLQLQNCAAPITIPGTGVVVNTALQIQANASGIVNSQVWPVDVIDCNGTTGQSMYGVQYIVGGVPTADPLCYQPVSTMGAWNLSTLQPIACTQTPPNPQDAQYRNLNLTGCLTFNGSTCLETPYVSTVLTTPQTVVGPLSVKALNNIQKADQFTGATAAEQIVACLAAGSICDATGLTGTQSIDTMIEVGIGGANKSLILDRSTIFQPTVAGMTMFKVDRNGQVLNLHVIVSPSLNFTGKVVDVEDTITTNNVNAFSIDGLNIDATTYSAGGTGLYLAPPSGS